MPQIYSHQSFQHCSLEVSLQILIKRFASTAPWELVNLVWSKWWSISSCWRCWTGNTSIALILRLFLGKWCALTRISVALWHLRQASRFYRESMPLCMGMLLLPPRLSLEPLWKSNLFQDKVRLHQRLPILVCFLLTLVSTKENTLVRCDFFNRQEVRVRGGAAANSFNHF